MADIKVRIALEGEKDVERDLLALGKTGAEAFDKLKEGAQSADFAALGQSIEKLSATLGGIQAAVEKAGEAFTRMSESAASFKQVGAAADSASASITQAAGAVAPLNDNLASASTAAGGLNQTFKESVDVGTKVVDSAAKIAIAYAEVKTANAEATAAQRENTASWAEWITAASTAILAARELKRAFDEIPSPLRFIADAIVAVSTAIAKDVGIAQLEHTVSSLKGLGNLVFTGTQQQLSTTGEILKALAVVAEAATQKIRDVGETARSSFAKLQDAGGLRSGLQKAVEDAVGGIGPALSTLGTALGSLASQVGTSLSESGREFVSFGVVAATALKGVAEASFSLAQSLLTSGAESAKAVKDGAENLGTTAKNYQALTAAAAAAGIGQKEASAAFESFGSILDTHKDKVEEVRKKYDVFGTGVRVFSGGVDRAGVAMKAVSGVFGEFGISLTDLNGKAASTEQVLAVLADKLKALGKGDKQDALADKFGVKELLPLLDQGAAGIDKFIQAGARLNRAFSGKELGLAEAFEKASKGASTALADLDASIQRTKDGLGLLFAGNFKQGSDLFAGVIRAITTVLDNARPAIVAKAQDIKTGIEDALRIKFSSPQELLGDVAIFLIDTFETIAKAVTGTLAPAIKLIDSLFQEAATALNQRFGTNLSSTFLEVATAAGALAFAFGQNLPVIGPVVEAFKQLGTTLFSLGPILGPLGIAVVVFWDQFRAAGLAAFKGVSAGAKDFEAGLKSLFAGDFSGAWQSFKDGGVAAFRGLRDNWPAIWAEFKTIAIQTFNAIKDNAPIVWQTIKSIAIAIWPDIRDAAIAVLPALVTAARAVFNDIKAAGSTILREIFEGVGIPPALITAAEKLKGLFESIFGDLTPKINDFGKSLEPTAQALNRLLGTDLTAEETGTLLTLARMTGLTGDLTESIGRANVAFRLLNAGVNFFTNLNSLIEAAVAGFQNLIATVAAVAKTLNAPLDGNILKTFREEFAQAKANLAGLGDTFTGAFAQAGQAAFKLRADIEQTTTAGKLMADTFKQAGPAFDDATKTTTGLLRKLAEDFKKTGKINVDTAEAQALLRSLGVDIDAVKSKAQETGKATGALAEGFQRITRFEPGGVVKTFDVLKEGANKATEATAKTNAELGKITVHSPGKFQIFDTLKTGADGATKAVADTTAALDRGAEAIRTKFNVSAEEAQRIFNGLKGRLEEFAGAADKAGGALGKIPSGLSEGAIQAKLDALVGSVTKLKEEAASAKIDLDPAQALDRTKAATDAIAESLKKVGTVDPAQALNAIKTATDGIAEALAKVPKSVEIKADTGQLRQASTEIVRIGESLRSVSETLDKLPGTAGANVSQAIEGANATLERLRERLANLKLPEGAGGDFLRGLVAQADTAVEQVQARLDKLKPPDLAKAAAAPQAGEAGAKAGAEFENKLQAEIDKTPIKLPPVATDDLDKILREVNARLRAEIQGSDAQAAVPLFASTETAAGEAGTKAGTTFWERFRTSTNVEDRRGQDGSFIALEDAARGAAEKILDTFILLRQEIGRIFSAEIASPFQGLVDQALAAFERIKAEAPTIGQAIRDALAGGGGGEARRAFDPFGDMIAEAQKNADPFASIRQKLDGLRAFVAETVAAINAELARIGQAGAALVAGETTGGVASDPFAALRQSLESLKAFVVESVAAINAELAKVGQAGGAQAPATTGATFPEAVAAGAGAPPEDAGLFAPIKTGLEQLKTLATDAATAITTAFSAVTFETVATALDAINTKLTTLRGTLPTLDFAPLTAALEDLTKRLGDIFQQLITRISGLFQTDLVQAVQTAMTGIETTVTAMVTNVNAQLEELIKRIKAVASSAADAGGSGGGGGGGGDLPENAAGGLLRGPGSGTSDSFLSWVSDGEFINRAASVRYYGAPLFRALNSLRIPRDTLLAALRGLRGYSSGGTATNLRIVRDSLPAFADGGLASMFSGISVRTAIPSIADAVASGRMVDVNLNLGGHVFHVTANENAVVQLQREAAQQHLNATGRMPNWVGG